jgi:hypothetical protein
MQRFGIAIMVILIISALGLFGGSPPTSDNQSASPAIPKFQEEIEQ